MRSSAIAISTVMLAGLLATACSSTATGTGTGGLTSGVASSGAATDTGAPASGGATDTAPASSSGGVATETVTVTAPPVRPGGCTSGDLTVTSKAPPGGGAAGHEGVVLLFTNHSSITCTLMGYPGAAGLNTAGAQVAQASRTLSGMIGGCSCSTPPVLTLSPGTVVSAVIEGNIGGPGPCNAFASLLVTPPNTLTSTHIAATVPSCGFQIHPVVTGTSGGGPA